MRIPAKESLPERSAAETGGKRTEGFEKRGGRRLQFEIDIERVH